jgi:glycosyltransferase involved in cell wall biosynthesis
MRVLVVTNMYPTPSAPQRGRFVRDQVESLRSIPELEIELFTLPRGRRSYATAVPRLRRLLGRQRFDLVHAHYGLTGWCAALAGARPLAVTFHGTDVRHRIVGRLSRRLTERVDLVAGVSRALFAPENGVPGLPRPEGANAVLPCGVDLDRFRPAPRAEARARLDLDPAGRYLLFPADPSRPAKRHDRAVALATQSGAELLVASRVDPDRMPDWINAAGAVVVPSDQEGFGLAALEALACGVPVLSTPVGIAPAALAGVEGCLVAPYDAGRWTAAARAHLEADDPRVDGRGRAERFSAERMASRVHMAWRDLTELPAEISA